MVKSLVLLTALVAFSVADACEVKVFKYPAPVAQSCCIQTYNHCFINWNYPEDYAVDGFRVYVDNQLEKQVDFRHRSVSCDRLNLTNGPHLVYITAFSGDQESDPFNVITFIWKEGGLPSPDSVSISTEILQ